MVKKLLSLFAAFAKIGSIMFGGGLAMLPMLTREIVEKRKWATEDEILDYYAVGQCTPGIIAVNTATFIGFNYAGVLGGIVATIGIVTVPLIIILAIAAALQQFMGYAIVASALMGIRAVVCALLMHTVITLAKKSLIDLVTAMIFIIGTVLCFVFDLPPVLIVVIGGVIGLIVNKIREVRSK